MASRKQKPEDDATTDTPSPDLRRQRSYEDMHEELDDEHPVDALVARRLDHAVLQRRIRTATDRLVEALSEERDLWLRLEELLGEQRHDREAAYFDIGYEHGYAAGRAEALAESGPHGTAYRVLAQRLREATVNAGLPHERATAALLEAAWALLIDGRVPDTDGSRPKGKRA